MKKHLLGLLLLLGLCLPASANVPCSLPFNITNGTTADATQVMANYNAITACLSTGAAASGFNNDITTLNALTTPLTPAQGGASASICGAGGFTVVNASTTLLTIKYSQAIVTTTAGLVQFGGAATLTLNMAVTGVNGLDTGALAANKFYYIYLIGQGPGVSVIGALGSLSSTAPSMPSGYGYSCRVGVWMTGTGSGLVSGQIDGRRFQFNQDISGGTIGLVLQNNSTVGTCASTSSMVLTTFTGIPPTAVRASGFLFAANNAANIAVASYAATAFSAVPPITSNSVWLSIGAASNSDVTTKFDLGLPAAQKLYLCNGSTGNAIVISGWSDNVNAN